MKANFIQICSSRYYFGKLFVCASLATYPYAHMLRLCRRPKFSFKYSYLSSSTLTNHLLIHRLAQSLTQMPFASWAFTTTTMTRSRQNSQEARRHWQHHWSTIIRATYTHTVTQLLPTKEFIKQITNNWVNILQKR